MELNNFKYINEIYKLPHWFDFTDIDWIRYYPMKNNKIIMEPTIEIFEKGILENDKYIFSKEQSDIFNIFCSYLNYLNSTINNFYKVKKDITEDEMKRLLSIKICDYDWYFMWSNPEFDKNSNQFLLQKRT